MTTFSGRIEQLHRGADSRIAELEKRASRSWFWFRTYAAVFIVLAIFSVIRSIWWCGG